MYLGTPCVVHTLIAAQRRRPNNTVSFWAYAALCRLAPDRARLDRAIGIDPWLAPLARTQPQLLGEPRSSLTLPALIVLYSVGAVAKSLEVTPRGVRAFASPLSTWVVVDPAGRVSARAQSISTSWRSWVRRRPPPQSSSGASRR